MTDASTFGYEGDAPAGPVHVHPPPPGSTIPGPYKFSPDELRVLSECNRESFYQRSLPLGTAMGFTSFIALQKGYLKPNPRFGVVPKVTLAVVMGYFIGKLSYQEACAEKLMSLPGSYIGQLLKEKKDRQLRGASLQQQVPSMFGAHQTDIYSDAGPGSSLDIDTDRPLFNDDAYRPNQDGTLGGIPPAEVKPSQSVLTYEELRRRNRGEYSNTKQDPYRLDPNVVPPPPRRPPPPSQETPSPTNKYGDSME